MPRMRQISLLATQDSWESGQRIPERCSRSTAATREITGLKINNLDAANYAIDLSGAGLSGSGDYYVYVDSSTTYWRADGKFSTPGSITGTYYYDFANPSYYLDPSNSVTSLLVAGNVGIGNSGSRQFFVFEYAKRRSNFGFSYCRFNQIFSRSGRFRQ